MSFQQRTIGEICSELLAEAVRMGYSKRYVWGHMSRYLSIIRGYYRSYHICIFRVEGTDACLASYRIKYEQGTVTKVFFMHLSTTIRRLEEYALTGGLSIVTWNKRSPRTVAAVLRKYSGQIHPSCQLQGEHCQRYGMGGQEVSAFFQRRRPRLACRRQHGRCAQLYYEDRYGSEELRPA